MDGDPAVVLGHRDHRVVLDVELLLVADPVLALEDEVGRRERGVGVARRRARRRRTGARRRAGRRPPGASRFAGARRGGPPGAWPGRARRARPAARRGAGSRPRPATRIGWSALIELTMLSPGMSAAVTTTTLDQSNAGSRSSATNRACASVERIVAPYQAPGKTRSSAYFAAPVSLAGPSRRSGAAPRRAPGRERAGLDDDGAGRRGPGRQLGHGPSSMASDSITGATGDRCEARALDARGTVSAVTTTVDDARIEAARERVEAVLERLRHVDLQVVVVAPPDMSPARCARSRPCGRSRGRPRRSSWLDAAAAAREGTLRSFALGGFSGTWAATEMSASVANARDRVAAAAAFEEAAMAAVVEDLVDDETLELLQATSHELDRSTGLPAPGSLAGVTSSRGSRRTGPRARGHPGVGRRGRRASSRRRSGSRRGSSGSRSCS